MCAKRLFVGLTALLMVGLLGSVRASEPTPLGVGVRMTILGPAFVDTNGMTLYYLSTLGFGGARASTCSDDRQTERLLSGAGYNAVEEFPILLPDAASTSLRSCAEKHPPFLAPAAAKPIGDWTLQPRASGALQWAYRGAPLYRSIKDKGPGQINVWWPDSNPLAWSAWRIAGPPLNVPSGIQARLTSLGLALTSQEGKPLYYASNDVNLKRGSSWKPVVAPAVAATDHLPADWSIVPTKTGLRQWAWKNHPLFTYELDAGDLRAVDDPLSAFVEVFGDVYGRPVFGWSIALLAAASAPPAGLRIKSIHPKFGRTNRVYADVRGKTVYAIHCREGTRDSVDCDDVGDSPRYWLTFCGGEERCRRDWRPVVAPEGANPVDGLWTVLTISGSHPFKRLKQGEAGIPVWAYRGRPVFTYAEDQGPDDAYGEFDFYSTVMSAVAISAFNSP